MIRSQGIDRHQENVGFVGLRPDGRAVLRALERAGDLGRLVDAVDPSLPGAERFRAKLTNFAAELHRLGVLTDGTRAETTVLPDEDADEYDELRARLHAELEPVGAVEEFLVDRFASGAWRLRRTARVECEVFQRERSWTLMGEEVDLGLAFTRACNGGDVFSRLSRYEGELGRALHRTLHELERVQAARLGQPRVPPVAMDVNISADSV